VEVPYAKSFAGTRSLDTTLTEFLDYVRSRGGKEKQPLYIFEPAERVAGKTSPGRHCHSTLSLTVIDCHSLHNNIIINLA
jgi:hypothetical protein